MSESESDDDVQEMALAPPSSGKRGGGTGVGGGAGGGRSDTCNEAAILLKLEQLRGGIDPDSDDVAWLETLDITATDPVEMDDAEEGQRELAFYSQALAAVKSAQTRLTKMDVPFLRPDDYFAEMLKTDQHMAKVKVRLIRQQEGVFNTEQRRKQQHNKKFGKQARTHPPRHSRTGPTPQQWMAGWARLGSWAPGYRAASRRAVPLRTASRSRCPAPLCAGPAREARGAGEDEDRREPREDRHAPPLVYIQLQPWSLRRSPSPSPSPTPDA